MKIVIITKTISVRTRLKIIETLKNKNLEEPIRNKLVSFSDDIYSVVPDFLSAWRN